ncbi:LysR family transcriptional regulator [Mongoliitalea daihaiensis]|uniref:LysR family transcriptional regulator n=1 Tax=Mongoliitalea daihaiensis TaxID=2782006 RepID=UPI001F25E5CA|nr:LysR substrate-binding domain-containing protein [Mongoliitalea daihaiensis]UJP65015.1 LysR family transcriptional regulator [Mongoliitalea daihaiensis]
MNYTLHQLQIFMKVVQRESITKAAEDLHLSQPAVSVQLKNFQDQFEIPLTEVVGRKLYVTDFGKEIAEYAQKILEQIDVIQSRTAIYKGRLAGKLKISVVSTGKYVIPYFLSEFLKRNPDVELKLDVTNKAMVLNSLDDNEIDFALVSILPEALQVERIPLMENNLYLIAGKNFQLGSGSIEPDMLEKMVLIFREQGSGTRLVMERFLKDNDIYVQRKLELTSNEAVKQAVLAGLGCSVMPLIGIKNELRSGELKIIPIKGLPIVTNWHLIHLKNKRFSPVAHAFLDFIVNNKEEIINEHFQWYRHFK